MFGPKHKAVDVARYIAEGLRNGTITLDDNPNAETIAPVNVNTPAVAPTDHLTYALHRAETVSVEISDAERERLATRIEAVVSESAELHKASQNRQAASN